MAVLDKSWCLFPIVLLALACADQGEGERCDPLNGNADCASGLVCVKADRLALVDVGAVCCPPPGDNQDTVKECRSIVAADSGGVLAPTGGDAGSSMHNDAMTPAHPDAASSMDASIDASQ